MSTALEMTPEEWSKFRPTKKIVVRASQGAFLAERRAKALELAKTASSILRQRYGAKRVVVFGSLARDESIYRLVGYRSCRLGYSPG